MQFLRSRISSSNILIRKILHISFTFLQKKKAKQISSSYIRWVNRYVHLLVIAATTVMKFKGWLESVLLSRYCKVMLNLNLQSENTAILAHTVHAIG